MTKGDDIGLVKLRYTPLNDLIGTILEQIRIIPEKGLHLGQKFELILLPPMQRHFVGDKIVRCPHTKVQDCEQCASIAHQERSQKLGWRPRCNPWLV
jgi:hypothetical protein